MGVAGADGGVGRFVATGRGTAEATDGETGERSGGGPLGSGAEEETAGGASGVGTCTAGALGGRDGGIAGGAGALGSAGGAT
ncbi:MAG: hypothetical protein WBG19_05835, partial [Thermoplasmata archaeon]